MAHMRFGPEVPYVSRKPRQQQTCAPQKTPRTQTNPITCFTPGTCIATINGLKPVEMLEVDDRVLTRDRGFQPIRWIGNRRISGTYLKEDITALPVLIRANALGDGRPERDIIVSPNHRLLTTDKSLLSPFGENEALITSNTLIGQPGIMQVIPHRLTYIHLLLDQHEVILSDNLWSESFHLGRAATAALLAEQHDSLREFFPQIDSDPESSPQTLARFCLSKSKIETLHLEAPALLQ